MIKQVNKKLIPAFLMWLFDNHYKIIASNHNSLTFLKKKNGEKQTGNIFYKNLGLNKVGTKIYYNFCNEYLKNGKDFINNLNVRANQSQHIYSLFKFFGVKHEKL